ncbi:MAG TPA: MltA domain-containing protein [Stellaceae bacterium]|nr:MltA domain-containing protein [Stellaceae bacterium]
MTAIARRLPWIILALAALLVVAAAAYRLLFRPLPPPEPRLTLAPARFDQISGWGEDRVAAALPALLRSCKKLLARSDDAAVAARGKSLDFGTVADWRPACAAAASVPASDDKAARQFLEANFVPFLAGNNGEPDGLFTGYFEITLNGSRKRGGPYQTPLYRRPPEPNRHTRAEIEDGALAGKGLELVWIDDPVDAFFLEIQGSGRVTLPDGTIMRIGYDGQNGKPYVPVGRLLIERGELPRDKVTMASIRLWMAENPKKGAALRRENPSYVFFREISGEGPLGAQLVPLTAGRSLAVDRAFIPLGVPMFIDVRQRFAPHDTIRRLVVAQDTGGAIKGPVRGDLFWGHGKEAASGAGAMNARGRYYLLLPKSVAARLGAIS